MKLTSRRVCCYALWAFLTTSLGLQPSNCRAQAGTANLALHYTNSAFTATLGQYFKGTLYVNNPGWEIATNIVVTNQIPAGIEFISATCTRGTYSQAGGVITWNVGDFLPTAFATMTMEFKTIGLGSYTNTAGGTADTPEADPTNNQDRLVTSVTRAKFFGVGNTHISFYNKPLLTLITNNRVLVVGQHNGTTTDVYDPITRTFSLPAGATVGSHQNGSATLLTNGLVLLVGGGNPTGAKIAEVYNPATQLFRRVGDPLVYSYDHYATLQPDGSVVLCGGGMTTNELFNPVTETFSFAPAKQCAFNGIYLATGKYLYFSYGSAHLYDTNTSSSVPTSGFRQARAYHSATLLANGKVLIVGGYGVGGATPGPIASAELYDPVTDTFTFTANLAAPREHHSSCRLSDGTVLVAGGMVSESDPFSLFTAEVYDPDGTVNVPGIGIDNATLLESNAGTNYLQFKVWLTTNSALPVTVNFATAPGTAGASGGGVGEVDFIATNGILTIPAGQTNGTIHVPVFGDQIVEPDEAMTVTLSKPTQAWLARTTAKGSILNEDVTPTLSVSAVTGTVAEKDSGVVNLVYHVALSAASFDTVTVDYFTADGTATAGSDYIPIAGTLTFNPGETNKVLIVQAIGDLQVEPNETLTLNLTNSQHALLNMSQSSGMILDDDGSAGVLHHFEIAPISGVKTQTLAFPVTITARDSAGNVVSNYNGPLPLRTTAPYVATTNLDFEQSTLAPWTPAPPADNPGPYELTQYDVDGDGWTSGAFRLRINNGTDGIMQNVALLGGVTYRLSVKLVSAQEGGGCWVGATAVLQIGTSNVYWIMPDLCGGQSARQTISLDYTAPTNGLYPLNLIVGWGSVWWENPAADYFLYADDLQISYPVITPSSVTNGFVNGVWTGMVTVLQGATNVTLVADDTQGHRGSSNPFDVQPLADLNLTGSSQVQGTPPLRTGMKLQFNLALTNRGPATVSDAVISCPLPANLTFLSATNLQGVISNNAGFVTWTPGRLPPGTNYTAVLVCRADIPGDFTNEFNVTTAVLDLNPADNAFALSNHIDPPLLAIGDASGMEAYASATGMVFGLALSGPSAQTITVDYFTANGTATDNLDFTATNGTVTFRPGVTNASIVIYALEDILDEPNRTFTIELTNVTNASLNDSSGVGTVIDDDLPPVINIADANITEGDSGTKNLNFPLTLSKPAIVDVTVRCVTATGTAGTNDFVATTTIVTFPTGSTNTTFAVPIRGNTVNEPDETFTVALSLPSNASVGRTPATGTILNDDAIPGRLDHFTWDAGPSPRYANWPFPVILRAVDYLGNPATNASLSAVVTARTENGFLSRLQEDFEDGDANGWTNYITTFNTGVTNETAASGNNSLRLTGATGNLTAGLRRLFTNSTPNQISFAVRASRTNQVAGRFTATASSIYRSVVFYCNNNGQMGLLDRQLGFRGVPYQSNRWYQVALTVNWASQKIDCRIDGTLVLTNITFPDSSAGFMDSVVLANQDNTTSWWDDIKVFNNNITNTFAVTPSNFIAFVSAAKSNLVSIAGSATNTWLSADDGNEHVGASGYFDLLLPNLTLITPAAVTEGISPVAAQLQIPVPFPQAITVLLTSTIPSEVTVPASVVIPANQTNASFNLTVLDDALLDGTQTVTIIATATNFISATNGIAVTDNEPAFLTLTIPASAAENAGMLVNQGLVSASAPPSKPITVLLTSSDTNVVQVPATVLIPSNQLTATFNLTVVDNARIDGAKTATLTASVANWTNDSKTITVTDNETTQLSLIGPAQISEDSGAVNYTARLTGTLTTNLTIALTSSASNVLAVPLSAIIVAGQTSVVFSATTQDNALFDGLKLATLSCAAPGFTGASTNVTVLDSEAHHLSFAPISGSKTSSVPFAITLLARDLNDDPVTSFNSSVTLTGLAPGLVIVQPTNVTFSSGQWSGTVTLFTAEPQVTLQANGPNGVTGLSVPLSVTTPPLFIANVAASDLVYSPASERLWALVSGTLVPIDPHRQFIEPAVPVLTGASSLASGADGRAVHVICNSGTPHVRRFDTLTRAVTLSWTNSGLSIEDIAISPTNSDLIAISWACPGCSPRGRGVFLYENGVMRTNGFGVNAVEFGDTPDKIYGYNNDVYGTSYYVGRVDASGITVEGRVPILGGWSDSIQMAGGVLFGYLGGAFTPDNGGQLSSGNWWNWIVDKPSGRMFSVDYFGRIFASDFATFQPLGITSVASITNPSRLVRWGANGLAFVANSKVYIVRTPLLPGGGPPADLVLTTAATNFNVAISNTFACSLTVSNQGPNPATNTLCAVLVPANTTLLSAIPSTGTVTQSASGLVCALGTLPAGASASIALSFRAGLPSWAGATASVTSETTDANPTNNLLNLSVEVGAAPALDSITEIRQATTDLAWNANLGRIIVSVQNVPFLAGESLLPLDPGNTRFEPPIPVGHAPAKLSVHPAGRYVYAALDGETQITRVDLSNRVADLKFPVPHPAIDIAVSPSDPAIVVATDATWPQVLVYRNGVQLPNTVDPSGGLWERFIEFSSASPDLLYLAVVDGFARLQIDTNGATVLEGVGGMINGYDRDMRCDGGRVFTTGGRVFDPEAKTNIAALPYSGLVAPDASCGRVFYLTGSGATYTLTALNFTNLQVVGSLSLSNISGTPTSLIRWGTDGLAFRTTGGQIFLIRTTLADDRDNDTLPDSWEQKYFGALNAPDGSTTDDPDLDGFNNLQEARAGLDPHQFDNLRLLNSRFLTGGGFQCEVIAQTASTHVLFASTNLRDWTAVQRFTTTNLITALTDAFGTSNAVRFYRVGPVTDVPGPHLGFAVPAITSNQLQLRLEGVPGFIYRLESSTNLTDWSPVTTFLSTNPVSYLQDGPVLGGDRKFYRIAVP